MITESVRKPVPAGLLLELVKLLGRYQYPVGDLAQIEQSLTELAGHFRGRRDAQAADEASPAAPERPDAGAPPGCGHLATCPGCGGCAGCGACYCDRIASAAGPLRAAATGPEDAQRRAVRWRQVADVIAVGVAAPPAEVRISDDGWSLDLRVTDEAQVQAWAEALSLGELQVRIYSPGRGQVAREMFAAETHPYAARVSWVEALPPLPTPARKVAAAAGFVAVPQ